jgi:hypothetical protein
VREDTFDIEFKPELKWLVDFILFAVVSLELENKEWWKCLDEFFFGELLTITADLFAFIFHDLTLNVLTHHERNILDLIIWVKG